MHTPTALTASHQLHKHTANLQVCVWGGLAQAVERESDLIMTLYPVDCPGLSDLCGILVSSAPLHSINQASLLAQTV